MSDRKWRPTCPHCSTEFDAEDVWYSDRYGKVHTEDGDESELICPNIDCEKKFSVVCIQEIKFEVNGD